jgi:putative membrane-bound dehydrogenase-like protein
MAGPSGIPFSVPAGFVAEEVAGPPLVTHPMFACFDERGRLYVAGSSGQDFSMSGRLHARPDVIRRLEDSDGDGRFDKSTVFADRLTYPQGVLWHGGAVYVASPPSLWRLEDSDDDGVADRRRELLTGFPFTGIADDLHGPCLGPDGRIYWGVGRFPYNIRYPGGPIIRSGRSPLIMRSRPDGRDVGVVSAGMGNPVEVAFSPEGEAFACGTFFAPPAMGEGLRDAIIHCVEGGVFPIRDVQVYEDKRTGDLLPPLTHLGVAAPSGLMRARGGILGDDDRIVLLSALFNMHKVQRHVLEREGATFRSRDEDFLVSAVPDFHPTDVLEDADGSLLVVDTGGWFRSCPTSQIARKDVLGAIYRVRRRDAARVEDPRGLKLDWSEPGPDELVRRLDDPRFAVRDRAVGHLAGMGDLAVPALGGVVLGGASPRARMGAAWALARIEGDAARPAARPALRDADARVRLVAAHVAGLHVDAESLGSLMALLKEGEPAVRREAAAAIGRIGRPEGVAALLEGLRSAGDRFLDHALIFALIAIDDREETLKGLGDPDPNVRRGALIALDQMRDGGLTADLVTPFLAPNEPALQQAALRIIASRPAWAHDLVSVLGAWLSRDRLDEHQQETLRNALPSFARDPSIQELVASALRSDATPAETRSLLLDAIALTPLAEFPESWRDALRRNLGDRDARVARQAAITIRTRGLAGFDEALIRLARDETRAEDLRISAFEAAVPRLSRVDPELFAFLVQRLRPNETPLLRMSAARCLGGAPLDDGQLLDLTSAVARAGSFVLPRLLPAFGRSADRTVGARLVAALARSRGLRSLSAETLRATLKSYPPEIQGQAETLLKRLDVGEAEKAARLAELEPILSRGDARHGRDVFYGPRAACSTCHSVHAQGGRVGPDLTRIGAVRNGRDLLEAVVFPSASFARGYEPYLVSDRGGLTYNGVIAVETAEAITLVAPGRGEVRLSRSSVESVKPSRESIMPRGLEANMSREELTDLIAYLQSLK